MRSIKLGNLVRITGGGTPDRSNPEYWNGDIPWVTVKDFKGLELTGALEHITQKGLNESSASLIPAGSILVPTRMALGKVAICTVPVAINQDLKALQLIDDKVIDRDFLVRFLLSKSSYLQSQGKGATVKGITLNVLRDLVVPLLPKDEQQRIATILNKAESLRRKRQEAIRLADEFLRAVFVEMFGDPVTNSKRMCTKRMEELCRVATGATPSRNQAEYFSGPHPWIKTGEVDSAWITESEESISNAAIDETNCKLFPEKTVLVAMYGQGKTRGKVGMLGMPAATNQACAAILPSEAIDPFFVYTQLSLMYEHLRAMGRGGNQENLNLGMIKSLEILVPSRAEVDAFLSVRQRIQSVANSARSAHGEVERLVSSLSGSLLA